MNREEAKCEIDFVEFIIKNLQNRRFVWDAFLRPFRIMFYKNRLKKLKKIAGEEI